MTYVSYFRMESIEDDANQAFATNDMSLQVVQRRMIIWLDEVECGIPGGGHHEYGKLGYSELPTHLKRGIRKWSGQCRKKA
jgi:hypothetical protein